jgi:type I restriction enzyme M protein
MDNQVHNQIVSFIWGIADDCLRDVYVRGKYRDVILPMTVIRRLDAMLEETKPAVLTMKKQLDAAKIDNQWPALCNVAGQAFCNASPFLLKDLTSRAKAQTLKVDFIAYLDGFSPNVQVILDKFKFRNQIDTMIDADILGAVIEKFTSSDINLSPNPIYKDDAKTIIKHVGLDNHGMGTIFEELIRKFNEENNEEAGEHWTPRDVVELMADLVFVPIEDQIKDASYSCYDGACGTGGMLTVAQERLLKLAKERGKDVAIHLFGQEVNPETYAICTADMLLKGDGEEAEHIMYGSTLSDDQHASRQFDFMLSNPPYGKSWKTDAEKMGGKKEILDTRFNTYLEGGEAMPMIPRTSDGQLLFVLNNVAKMKKDTPLGSRIAEVHNGSSLFTGDAGSGESNARRYLIENDLVEAIIALPENMFYNTGIGTFIWILSNKKEERRKGKIQLIDASKMKSPLRKNMGKKNCEFTADIRADILRIFLEMEESEVSRIFNNDEFGYWSITVDRPLRQKVTVNVETIKQTLAMFKTLYGIDVEHEEDVIATVAPSDILSFTQNYSNVRVVKMPKTFGQEQTEQIYRMYMKALIDFVQEEPYMDYNAFIEKFYKNLHIKNNPFKFKKFEDFMYPLLEKDEKAEVVYDKGKPVVDMELRDTEIVPFTYEGGIDAFMKNEVLTYAPDAFVDGKKTTVGYEISFTKYFYKPVELREMSEILADLNALEQQADGMLASIMEGIL